MQSNKAQFKHLAKDTLILNKVIEFVDLSFQEKHPHHERALYWLLFLNPKADLALQIAAYAHDIQRAFASKEALNAAENSASGFKDAQVLKEHQETGGEIMFNFLKGQGVSQTIAFKVKQLIGKHEQGGTREQNLIKDADSISYFECNAEHFISKFAPIVGPVKVKDKFDWMFTRITSAKARKIAKPMYAKAIKDLAVIADLNEKNV